MLEPGNAMKWDVTQPTQTTFNFQPGDELVAFAQANGMRVRGHNLCWHSQLPGWLQLPNGTGGYAATATPAQMAALLQKHINTEVTHYAGEVFAWDVVNEAFSDSTPTTLGNSIWYNQPGIGIGTGSGDPTDTGYIEQAFRWAHAADPNALLFYNDYNIEGPGAKFNAVLAMVQDFVNRGVPINGVGFEMHLELGGSPGTVGLAREHATTGGAGHPGAHHGNGRAAAREFERAGDHAGGTAATGADIPEHPDGVPAAAQLHRVSSLGRLLQRFVDSEHLPRVWCGAAVRFQLSAHPGVQRAANRIADARAGAGR